MVAVDWCWQWCSVVREMVNAGGFECMKNDFSIKQCNVRVAGEFFW